MPVIPRAGRVQFLSTDEFKRPFGTIRLFYINLPMKKMCFLVPIIIQKLSCYPKLKIAAFVDANKPNVFRNFVDVICLKCPRTLAFLSSLLLNIYVAYVNRCVPFVLK